LVVSNKPSSLLSLQLTHLSAPSEDFRRQQSGRIRLQHDGRRQSHPELEGKLHARQDCRWRLGTRRTLTQYLAAGYRVAGFRGGACPHYVLEAGR